MNRKISRVTNIMEYNYYTPKKKVIDEQGEDEQDDLGMDNPELSNLEAQAGLNDNSEEESNEMNQDDAELGDVDLNDKSIEGLDNSVETEEDEIEIDISDLVDKQNQTSQTVQDINSKLEDITTGFGQYLDKVINMSDKFTKQFSDFEDRMRKELVKRNPTPNEKVQLQSVYSYPFDQKLTDFWEVSKDENDEYNTMDGSGDKFEIKKEENPELVLTQKDIDDSYSDVDVQNSF